MFASTKAHKQRYTLRYLAVAKSGRRDQQPERVPRLRSPRNGWSAGGRDEVGSRPLPRPENGRDEQPKLITKMAVTCSFMAGVAGFEPAASSSRSQVPGQATRSVTCLTSVVVSTVVCQRPWPVVGEVTHLVTRHQPDQQVAGGVTARMLWGSKA